jgi:hypothetical protein
MKLSLVPRMNWQLSEKHQIGQTGQSLKRRSQLYKRDSLIFLSLILPDLIHHPQKMKKTSKVPRLP